MSKHKQAMPYEQVAKFREALQSFGMYDIPNVEANGQLQRCKYGENDTGMAGYFALYDNVFCYAGFYGSWKNGTRCNWSSVSFSDLTVKQKEGIRSITKQNKQKVLEETTKRNEQASKEAKRLWLQSIKDDIAHPYLQIKQVKAYNLGLLSKSTPHALVVPVRDVNDKLWSLQLLYPEGEKRFLSGGRKKGCFHTLGEMNTNKIILCEGYATGASIHQATGTTVVVTFDAYNLVAVAEELKKHYKQVSFLVAADNDHASEQNTGKLVAEQIKNKHRIPYVLPIAIEGSKGTDFNDTAKSQGHDEIARQINLAWDLHKKTLLTKFRVSGNGVFFLYENKEGEAKETYVCSELRIKAITRDADNNNHGRLLQWHDVDGIQHTHAMPMRMLAGDGTEIRQILLDGGVALGSARGARQLLNDYLQQYPIEQRARCVSQTGWHGNCFLLPDTTIGERASEMLLFQSDRRSATNLKAQGTLDDWKNHIAKLCSGNSRLVFAVSMGFAPVLMKLTSQEGGGFHFKGNSSEGKSTALRLASSVYGAHDYMLTWRQTANALESTAFEHNDMLLILDEMGQVQPKDASESAYMLANGQGKGRATQKAEMKAIKRWRTLFLSSGEISLEDHLASANLNVKAGQDVRLADIPMSTGIHGGFEELHGYENGARFADHLNKETEKYHGQAFLAFVKEVQGHIQGEKISQQFQRQQNEFEKLLLVCCGNQAASQVTRVIRRFALVAFAGELATSYGITGWRKGEAEDAAFACFKAYVDGRGGVQNQEEIKAVRQVENMLHMHGTSRFLWIGDYQNDKAKPDSISNMLGLYDQHYFYIKPSIFKAEFTQGFNSRQVLKWCAEKGILAQEGKQKKNRGENVRYHWFKREKVEL